MPDTTQDCENDPNYDRDQVQNFLTRNARKDVRVATFFQVYAKLFHEEFNKEFGCTLPSFGGLKIADEEGHMLCLNTSIYNSTRMYEVDSQLMFIIVFYPGSDFVPRYSRYEGTLQGFRDLLRGPWTDRREQFYEVHWPESRV